ncbi:ATP-dependent Clp protease ATP-binding subunit [Rossellomorea vietnamensis]|uniref:ATP-dependent Clp protease ATP-binding subunit n=1 Tax=Rossellomorea vietnamensis TaxID=218284 RepID=A0A5D4NX25_9BACI|nr:AAA family ATPase [Rossellomorea vietnamensis]TYS18044.1 ATP-dependent Clp protease ATP-binding subunit [Rossellomorea vietnamensis]
MKIKIFYGPDNAFDDFIHTYEYTTMNEVMLQVVERDRSITIRTEESNWEPPQHYYETIVCYRQGYSSMTSSLINNILLLFRNVECNSLYLQNPPTNIVDTLQSKYDVEIEYYDYGKLTFDELTELKRLYEERIIGQERVLSFLLPVVNVTRVRQSGKPIVIMFYGPPGVGKTETAKIISEAIYKSDNIKRFQLSMYQTEHAYKFLFGSEPQEDSLTKELLSRETNVILLDEFDKVHPNLYSAFYELFDEGRIVDRNYSARVENAIFICTSNFLTMDEIKSRVGPAIFSRFTECIAFNHLSDDVKKNILEVKFNECYFRLPEAEQELLSKLSKHAMLEELGEQLKNMTDSRVIKNTIEKYLSYRILKEQKLL